MKPISEIDSSTNYLYFRGINVTELCRGSYETILHLLVHGRLPTKEEERNLSQRMKELRLLYDRDIASLFDLAGSLERIRKENELNLFDTLLTFVTLAPIVVAFEFGNDQQRRIWSPNNKLGHAANFLWMTRGILPNETDLSDFQASLILHMDDPQNPSLSALQATIYDGKTISDALLSALTVHTGPLHHGAGTEAMMMFEELREKSDKREYLKQRLVSGGKIHGLGHRIYRGIDPRAVILRQMLTRRAKDTSHQWIIQASDIVTKEGRELLSEYKEIDAYPNVDLYNAAFYFTFGFPPELNTSLFAVSRAAGWMAHTLEYLKS